MNSCEGDFYGNLFIENNWENDPSANPEGMAYFFFPDNGGAPWRFDMPGRDGGEIKIPTGTYDCILFNDDMANAMALHDDDYEDMSLTTTKGELYPGCDDFKEYPESVALQNQVAHMNPDLIWCYSIEDIKVELSDRPQIIHTAPYPVTATYHVIVKNAANLDGVAKMSGAMSGMAETLDICINALSQSAVILPCHLGKNGADGITGTFHTFGRCADPSINNILYLFFWLTDGRRYICEFNVTNMVKSAPDPKNVWVIIDNINIPESSGPQEGAFNVGVDGWNNIVITL